MHCVENMCIFCSIDLLLPPVASAPTNLTAVQEGPTGIRVSWTPPTPLGDTTGYRIYYSGGSSGSANVSGGSTDNHLLTGLQNGASYTISIVGTSDHLPSAASDPVNAKTKTKGDFTSFLLSSPPTCYMCIYAAALLSQCIAFLITCLKS